MSQVALIGVLFFVTLVVLCILLCSSLGVLDERRSPFSWNAMCLAAGLLGVFALLELVVLAGNADNVVGMACLLSGAGALLSFLSGFIGHALRMRRVQSRVEELKFLCSNVSDEISRARSPEGE